MEHKIILISGMPATGKSSLAWWLAKKLGVSLVSYDSMVEKTIDITERYQLNPKDYAIFPYEFFWFEVEEHMKVSSLFIAEYIYNDNAINKLKELTEKYNYQGITIHMNAELEAAYKRFKQRNQEKVAKKGMRPDISFETFCEGTKQNREFCFGKYVKQVDTTDFIKVVYEEIYDWILECLQSY